MSKTKTDNSSTILVSKSIKSPFSTGLNRVTNFTPQKLIINYKSNQLDSLKKEAKSIHKDEIIEKGRTNELKIQQLLEENRKLKKEKEILQENIKEKEKTIYELKQQVEKLIKSEYLIKFCDHKMNQTQSEIVSSNSQDNINEGKSETSKDSDSTLFHEDDLEVFTNDSNRSKDPKNHSTFLEQKNNSKSPIRSSNRDLRDEDTSKEYNELKSNNLKNDVMNDDVFVKDDVSPQQNHEIIQQEQNVQFISNCPHSQIEVDNDSQNDSVIPRYGKKIQDINYFLLLLKELEEGLKNLHQKMEESDERATFLKNSNEKLQDQIQKLHSFLNEKEITNYELTKQIKYSDEKLLNTEENLNNHIKIKNDLMKKLEIIQKESDEKNNYIDQIERLRKENIFLKLQYENEKSCKENITISLSTEIGKIKQTLKEKIDRIHELEISNSAIRDETRKIINLETTQYSDNLKDLYNSIISKEKQINELTESKVLLTEKYKNECIDHKRDTEMFNSEITSLKNEKQNIYLQYVEVNEKLEIANQMLEHQKTKNISGS